MNAKNWRWVETVIVHSCFDMSTCLLETAKCDKLTSIDISFGYFNKSYDRMKTFIASIDNAPSLEQLVLRSVEVRLTDVENIHKGASNLNSLKLDDSHISAEDTCALIHLDSAENIKTLSICASLIDEMNEEREAQPMDILLQE